MKKVLIAVSGGPDSMALLDTYKKLAFGVCHVNYNKRPTAKRDELIVKNYCLKNKIKFFCKRVTKKEYDKSEYNNFQATARHIRYEFFVKVAKKYNIKTIYIGHNMDDFVETAYMQKQRKSKALCYGIMRETTYKGLEVYRPLISLRKKYLEQYCIKNNIPYGIDESNFSDKYERNRVRKIISKWSDKKLYSYATKILDENCKNLKLVTKLNEAFHKWFKSKLSIDVFNKQTTQAKQYIVYTILKHLKIECKSTAKLNSIISFMSSPNNSKKYRVGNNIYLVKHKGRLDFSN